MAFKIISPDHYPRRVQFEYFRSLAYPYAGVTVDIDVTDIVFFCRNKGFSLTLAMLHAAALAADEVPELRQRIRDGQIIEYSECPTSHIETDKNGMICYCTLHHHMSWDEYMPYAQAQQAAARSGSRFAEDEDVMSEYFVSVIPWLHYTALTQPAACGEESNPRITWGKYDKDANGNLKMPLSLLAHHALVDGLQIARFYENIKIQMERIVQN